MVKNCCKYFTVSLVPVASLTLAVLFGVAVVALPVLYVELAEDYRYGIIIDAGSSHTDAIFYKWVVPRYKDTGNIKEIGHCRNSHSINSYADDPSKAGVAVRKCINVSIDIPNDQRSNTQLYLGATAGMRLVYCQNETLGEEIMQTVNSTLMNSSYHLVSGKVISGQEEAVSGWMAGNYLADQLQHKGSPLNGSLDLGGASAEIAFLAPAPRDNPGSPYLINASLYDRNYTLYARTYLCYGLNEAYARFLAYLIHESSDTSQPIPNPCLLEGTNITFTAQDIYSSECVQQTCSGVFEFGFSPPHTQLLENDGEERDGEREEDVYTFSGTGNATECASVIGQALNLTNCSESGACVHKEYFQPPINNTGTFLGMSGFYSIADFFNQSRLKLHSLSNFSEIVHKFCELSNQTATNKFPKDQYLHRMCFDGVFSLFLLQNGFGFNSNNSNWTLHFVEKVNQKNDVGWALGYLLQQTTMIPDTPYYTDRPFRGVDLAVGITVLAILCVVFIVFFLLTLQACRKMFQRRGGYTNI